MKLEKIECDLNFLLNCKKTNVIPKFAKPKLSIFASYKIKQKIARTIIEAELNNKHREKKKTKRELKELSAKLSAELSFIAHQSLKYRVRSLVAAKKKGWKATHEKKMQNLKANLRDSNLVASNDFAKKVVHNFSSHHLTQEEVEALSYGIDHYIPVKTDKRKVEVEFELFYKNVLLGITDLPEDERIEIKTGLLNACKRYTSIKVPYKYQEVIQKLSKNNSICLLKQDKGRGVVVVNRSDYVTKCEQMLQSKQFVQLNEDPTARFERRVQKTLRDLKKNKRFTEDEYAKIYPSSSRPGRFYATGKRHKVPENSTDINQLPLRPIVTNIGTATYGLSKHLAALLRPLSVSSYTISSTKDFVDKIRDLEVPEGHKLVSFDVTSLFTNVPLDYTIEVILRKIYQEKLIKTKIKKDEMRTLLQLCTKELHFSFNGKIYKQVDGVVMGNPLGPVIANIFMVELENKEVPALSNSLQSWYRYVDDTIAFVKEDQIENIVSILNNHHKDIKFTHEFEEDGAIPFLDVHIQRKPNNKLRLKVYRKKTCSNIYIHWNAFAPTSWKIGTLEGMIRRAYMICSEEDDLETELSFITNTFQTINGYPTRIIQRSLDKMREKLTTTNDTPEEPATSVDSDDENGNVQPFMVIPYAGKQGEKVMKKIARKMPESVRPKIVYNGTKLSTFFSAKDKVLKEHCSNLIYYYQNKDDENAAYIGETKCRFGKRIQEHQGSDKQSAIVLNFQEKNLPPPSPSEFSILGRNYTNRLKRRIAESLFIKEKKSALNIQVDSYRLKLFN